MVIVLVQRLVESEKSILKIAHAYFFDDLINIKNLDPNNIKVYEKSYKNILIYYGYVTTNTLYLRKWMY